MVIFEKKLRFLSVEKRNIQRECKSRHGSLMAFGLDAKRFKSIENVHRGVVLG